jgi:hypothetical protein
MIMTLTIEAGKSRNREEGMAPVVHQLWARLFYNFENYFFCTNNQIHSWLTAAPASSCSFHLMKHGIVKFTSFFVSLSVVGTIEKPGRHQVFALEAKCSFEMLCK